LRKIPTTAARQTGDDKIRREEVTALMENLKYKKKNTGEDCHKENDV